MADEQETTNQQKAKTTTIETKISNDTSGTDSNRTRESNGGRKDNRVSIKNQSETFPTDPLINIGCRFQNGIIINLPPRSSFRLQYGFTKLNKSIWEMIVASGQYDELIKEKTIYLSKNGR